MGYKRACALMRVYPCAWDIDGIQGGTWHAKFAHTNSKPGRSGSKLAVRRKPYTVRVAPGIRLGYRRNATSGTWSVLGADGQGGSGCAASPSLTTTRTATQRTCSPTTSGGGRKETSPTCADWVVRPRQINGLGEKSPLHFFWEVGSGAACEARQLAFGEAHSFGQDDAETIKECGLSRIGLGDATQADLAVGCGR